MSVAALVALAVSCVISYSTGGSGRVLGLATFVQLPAALLLLAVGWLSPRDFRWRGAPTIFVLMAVGLAAIANLGLHAGASGVLFLALIFTALLFGKKVMIALLLLAGGAVAAIAWLMVSARLPPPLPQDVSFELAHVWLRTGANVLLLIGLCAVVCAEVVAVLEQALVRVQTEAAERERAQRERAQALELALEAQKVELVGRLAAGMAHDFNNALFVIDVYNHSLQEAALSGSERAEMHGAISVAVQQSSSLASQLLSLARKHVASPEPLSTRLLVEDLRKTLTRLLPDDVRVVVECDQDAVVRADKLHVQQALLNLVINARDAMSGPGTLTLRASTRVLHESLVAVTGQMEPGRFATLEVQDTGTGMDAATRARAFEPLFTTKPEGKGTGLGLSSVLSTVQMSGGHVTLWSEPGSGTRVTLYLPVIEAPPAEAMSAPDGRLRVDLRGTTVLVAEDAPDVRSMLRRALEHQGCTVMQASDGTRAIDLIESAPRPIDVLCTDAVMPGAPVREVIACLKRRYPSAVVLVISGYVADELMRRGIEHGDYRVLAKPFTTRRLLETIAELTGRDQPSVSAS